MKSLRYFGIFAAFLFFIIASISIAYNPWFKLLTHAFSHLGSYSANKMWIYNYGMMLLGLMLGLYGISFIIDSINKIETVAGAYITISGIFLALIGIYHMGTSPHNTVSYYFFMQSELAMIVAGIGLVITEYKRRGIALLVMCAFSLFLEFQKIWPSVALLEAFAILTLMVRVSLLTSIQLERER